MVNKPPANEETQVGYLDQKGSLEKEIATHSNLLCLENTMNSRACGATVGYSSQARERV